MAKKGLVYFLVCFVFLIYSYSMMVLKAKQTQNRITDVIQHIGYSSHTVLAVEVDYPLPETWTVYKFKTIDRQSTGMDRIKKIPWDYMIVTDLHKSYGDKRILQWNQDLLRCTDYVNVLEFNRSKVWFTDSIEYSVFKRIERINQPAAPKIIIGSKSNYSYNGKWSLDELAAALYKHGVRTWMPTDVWESRFELYGRVIDQKSIKTVGVKKYLSDIKRLQKKYPKMKIIPGAEVMEGYRWTGSLLKFNLTLHSGRKYYATISDTGELKWFKDIKSDRVPVKIKHQFAYYQPAVSFYEYGKAGYTSNLNELYDGQ